MVERDGNTSVYKSVLPCRGLIEYYYDSETTVSKVFIFVFRYSWGNAIHFFFSHLSKLGLEFLNRKCVISFFSLLFLVCSAPREHVSWALTGAHKKHECHSIWQHVDFNSHSRDRGGTSGWIIVSSVSCMLLIIDS